MLTLFFKLCIGHFLCDYPLQGDFIAKYKSHKVPSPLPGVTVWWHCLTAHAAIQAGAVWVIAGSPACAAAEFVLHWGIDWMKSEGWTDFHADQAVHIICRFAYAACLLS